MYEEPDIDTFLYVYRCLCCLFVAPYFCALCLSHSLTVHVWTGHPSLFVQLTCIQLEEGRGEGRGNDLVGVIRFLLGCQWGP